MTEATAGHAGDHGHATTTINHNYIPSKTSFGWVIGAIVSLLLLLMLVVYLGRMSWNWASPPVRYYTADGGSYIGPSGPIQPFPYANHTEGATVPNAVSPGFAAPAQFYTEIPSYTIVNRDGFVIDRGSQPVNDIGEARMYSAARDCQMVEDRNFARNIQEPRYYMPARCGPSCGRCRGSCGMYCRCSGNGPGPCRCR